MWRNFRIRTKMLIGFAVVLAVFGAAVAVTWSYLYEIRKGAEFIADKEIPAQDLCSTMNESAYELFLAMHLFQLQETEAAAAGVKKWMADVQKKMDETTAFYVDASGIKALTDQVNIVFPNMKEYFEIAGKFMASTLHKNETYDSMIATAQSMSLMAENLKNALLENAQKEMVGAGHDTYLRYLAVVDAAGNIETKLLDARRAFQHAVAGRDVGALNAVLNTLEEDVAPAMENTKAIIHVPESRRVADEISRGLDVYKEAMQAFIANFKELEEMFKRLEVLSDKINLDTSESINTVQAEVLTLSKNSLQEVDRSITVLYSSAIIAVLSGVGIAFVISRSIAAPLGTIVGLAERAGGGDLTIAEEDFRYKGRDELGLLVDALSAMITSQEEALRQIILVSDGLASGSVNLSAISEETNASMEEVKASIDQISTLSESNGAALEECNAGVEELSAGADTVAQSATDGAAFISHTTEVSSRAIQTVDEVIHGMRDVNMNAMEVQNKITQLVSSVENVSGFVSVIKGIADQTNLLALNAAIEAARAGEAGRGFAVVAEEVRKLAEESARSAQNVNGIIVELQSGAQESIEATTEAGHMLGNTLAQAEQAQGELNDALKEMNKANDSIQNIAAVAEEQAASCKEVASAIDGATRATMEMVETISNIRNSSEETAATAQNVAEQSETLNGHVEEMAEVLSHFKLNGNIDKTSSKQKPKAFAALKAR